MLGCAPNRPERADAMTHPLGRLHVITDATLQTRFRHAEIARRAVQGGADIIQFREKRPHGTQALVALVREVREAVGAGFPLIVNDRADVALEVGADGVHIGRDDLSADTARAMLGDGRLIGGTVNSLEAAGAWFGRPVDYLGVGPVYGTTSKDDPAPVLGLETLRRIVAASPVPVIAIGGIRPEHVRELLACGVWGVAVLSGVACAADPAAAARRYRDAIDGVLRDSTGGRGGARKAGTVTPANARAGVAAGSEAVLPARADVVVVGAGVVGLACAYALAERGRVPLVLERDDAARSATWAAGGMLGAALESDVELEGLDTLRRAAQDAWPDFAARIDARVGGSCGYLPRPSLLVALHRDHELELERSVAMIQRQGFDAFPLDRSALLDREPSLSSRVLSGVELPRDHAVDPRTLVNALARAVESLGGRIVHGATVEEVEPNGAVHGRRCGSRFCVAADAVVLATGAWSQEGPMHPFSPLPVRPVKGQLVLLRAPSPTCVVRTPDVYLVPRAGGRLAVGATTEERGFDASPTVSGVARLLYEAWRTIPELDEAPIDEIVVGFRPAARDHRPIIGRLGDTAVLVATGHYRNGLLLAPLTARAVADLVDGTPLDDALAGFGPERFVTEPVARRK